MMELTAEGTGLNAKYLEQINNEEDQTERFGVVNARLARELLMLSHGLRMMTVPAFEDLYVTNVIQYPEEEGSTIISPLPRDNVRAVESGDTINIAYNGKEFANLQENVLLGGFAVLLKNETVFDDTGEYKYQSELDTLLEEALGYNAKISLKEVMMKYGKVKIPVFYIVGENCLVRIPSTAKIVEEIVKNFNKSGAHLVEV